MPRPLLRASRLGNCRRPRYRTLGQADLGVELLEERCVLSAAANEQPQATRADDVLASANSAAQTQFVSLVSQFALSTPPQAIYSLPGVSPNGDYVIAGDSRTGPLQFFDAAGQPKGNAIVPPGSIIDLEVDERGRTIISCRAGSNYVLAQYGPDGQLITSVTLPSFGHDGNIGVDAAGNVTIVWEREGQPGTYAQRYDDQLRAIGGPILLALTPPIFDELPTESLARIAMSSSGDFVVVWTNTGANGAQARLFHADGTPKGEMFDVAIAHSSIYFPGVAMGADGSFAIIWNHSPSNGVVRLYGQWFDAAGNRRGPERQLSESPANCLFPWITMDARGNSLVSWGSDSPESPSTGYAQAFLSDGQKIGPEMSLAPIHPELPLALASMNASGEAVLTWSSGYTNYAQRFAFLDGAWVDLNGSGVGRDYRTQHKLNAGPVVIVDADQMFVTDAGLSSLVSAAVSISGYRAGDQLFVNTTGTSITAIFANGVLSLSGADTVAHYQQVLRTVQFDTTAPRIASSTVEVTFVVNDGFYDSNLATSHIEIFAPGSATVAARKLFYNDSFFDFNDPGIGNPDDKATPNKTAYLPGTGVATFASVSSYSKGINGIMIDLAGTHGEISLADLEFRVGTTADPANWATAPTPSGISLRPGWGLAGADRLEVTWPNNSIRNQWLEVRVKANAHTGLASDDLFYWASRIGDVGAGTPAGVFLTSALDATAVLNQLGHALVVDALADFNRDGVVSAIDKMIAVYNIGGLVRLNLGAVAVALAPDVGIASALAATSATTSDVRSLPTATEPPRTAITADVVTRAVGPADLVTPNTRTSRLARAADIALSLEDGWSEPAEPLVDELI